MRWPYEMANDQRHLLSLHISSATFVVATHSYMCVGLFLLHVVAIRADVVADENTSLVFYLSACCMYCLLCVLQGKHIATGDVPHAD
jgi:hypothetical protein